MWGQQCLIASLGKMEKLVKFQQYTMLVAPPYSIINDDRPVSANYPPPFEWNHLFIALFSYSDSATRLFFGNTGESWP